MISTRKQLIFLLAACGCTHLDDASVGDGLSTSTRGMVSAADSLATAAGVRILEQGGNAFDAAVAVAAALNVVEPMMSGLGGYGTIMVYHAETQTVRFLNSSGRIPADVDSDVYRAPSADYMANRRGAKAVSTPGNANAWEAMSQEYGALRWRDLLQPAIALATDGFVLDERVAGMIEGAFETFSSYSQSFYGRSGQPLRAGQRLIQTDLARSLNLIADSGATALHGGSLGAAIDAAMQSAGGFLTLADLANNRAEWWDPIRIRYRAYDVYTASPPANAFPALVRLGMMSQYDVEALGHNSTAYLHRFAEVTKHAFWTRLRYAGDPDVAPPPLNRLLSNPYWQEQADLIDPTQATTFAPPGVLGNADQHTTHFVVADERGNIVSATQTLGNVFGSRIMPEGTGIWLNNSLAYSTFEPKGNPMDAHAGRRKLSGDVPTIVFRDGRPWLAIGTPGGHTIGQTVPQMVMNAIDFEMDVYNAIAAPRVSFIEPNLLAVEDGIPIAVRDSLVALGHEVQAGRTLGNATGLMIDYDSAGMIVRFVGAADPRGNGRAFGPVSPGR